MTHIEEARVIAFAAAGQVHNNEDAKCVETLVEKLVYAALAAAEERGRIEERERCAKIATDMAPFTEETISTATAGAILFHAFDVTLSRFARRISAAITKEPTP